VLAVRGNPDAQRPVEVERGADQREMREGLQFLATFVEVSR